VRFLVEALRRGESTVTIATADHRDRFMHELARAGLDTDADVRAGRLVVLDADDTLAKFMGPDGPDAEAFRTVVGAVLHSAASVSSSRSVRAYGVLVDVLWRAGRHQAALALERRWNDLRDEHDFALLCAYAARGFDDTHDVAAVCATHTHVLSPDAGVASGDMKIILSEIAERTRIEAQLRTSVGELRTMEEELRLAKDDLEEFLESAVLAIHRVDRDGIIRWANRAELELLGYAPHEYIGHHIGKFHADREVIADILARLKRGESIRDYEARVRAKDGTLRDVAISSNVQTRDGEFITTRCFSRDITEIKQAQRDRDAVYETSKRLQREIELERLVQCLTGAAAELCHADYSAFFYANGSVFSPQPVGSADRRTIAELFQAAFRGETTVRRDDTNGALPFCSGLAVPVTSIGSELLGVLVLGHARTAAFTDREQSLIVAITAQAATMIHNARLYEAERAARAQAEIAQRQSAFLQRLTSALSVTRSAEDAISIALHECRELVGGDGGGALLLDAQRSAIDAWLSDGRRPSSLAEPRPVCDAARTGELIWLAGADAVEARYPQLDDPYARGHVETIGAIPLVFEGITLGAIELRCAHARPLSTDDRAILLAIGRQCGQAIERARLHQSAVIARREAEQASRAKDEFLAMLGHELRNPLAPILTAVQLMRLRGDTASTREQNVIERQVRHLIGLVDDLLDISRITRGKVKLERHPVRLAPLLTKALEIVEPLCLERKHTVAVHQADDDIWLEADETRLCQVFTNLLSNAAKYTPPGGRIELTAQRLPGRVRVSVRDNGVGIPSELIPRIFDLFVQGKRTPDRSQGGLGIGLALVRNLVALHGGATRATSAGDGLGSEFVVELPTIELHDVEPRVNERSVRRELKVAPRRIHVVDDNQDAGELLADVLRSVGHEVVVALDGPRALDVLTGFEPHVAILDIGLPVMDGYELARVLRSRLGDAVRLMAVTGYGQEHDRTRGLEAGFEMHFTKPVGVANIVAAIEVARARDAS
jgi:PAS domain S-box-containing protein